MMRKPSRAFGSWGESLAASFLGRRGYEILEKNYRKRCGEIDIIARKDGLLRFIEVKTRTEGSVERFGRPEEAVGFRKRQRLIAAAQHWLLENGCGQDIDWQIDIISIVSKRDGRSALISHIPNAFDESWL